MQPLVMMRLVTSKSSESLQRAGQDLAADRVAQVMGDEHDPLEPDRLDHRLGGVGVPADAVADVGLVGEPEAEEVEEDDATAGRAHGLDHRSASRTSRSGTRAG